jgi:mRNA interferase MazF
LKTLFGGRLKTLIKRGELYEASEKGVLTRKPRPVLVIQNDHANVAHQTITVCLLSSQLTGFDGFRILLDPTEGNGLKAASEVQVDRIFSYRPESLVQQIGALSRNEMERIENALRRWLEL